MAILPGNTDYTDLDFENLKARLEALVTSVFPQWRTGTLNFENVLLEMYAFVGDALTYYQNHQAEEAFLARAQLRRNVTALARMLNYTPAPAAAATVDVTVTLLSAPPTADVVIDAGRVFRTASATSPQLFQLLSAITIPSGTATGTAFTASVEHSTTRSETKVSTGLPSIPWELTHKEFVDGSMVVVADNGAYTAVSDFLDSEAADLHVVVDVDNDERPVLTFGDGTYGAIPTGTITATYKTGGGTAGNVGAGTITRLDGPVLDQLGNPVSVSITNAAAATGGAARETIASIKEQAPLSLRAIRTSVARGDFEINAKRLAGVGRALMLTADETVLVPENTGYLYILPTGGGLPSSALKASVLTQVTTTYPAPVTFNVGVYDVVYQIVDIRAVIFLAEGVVAAAARVSILADLTTFFAAENSDGTENTNVDFGFNRKNQAGAAEAVVAWSDVQNVVRDNVNVRRVSPQSVTLNGVVDDVALELYEFPSLGTLTLINGDTGDTIT